MECPEGWGSHDCGSWPSTKNASPLLGGSKGGESPEGGGYLMGRCPRVRGEAVCGLLWVRLGKVGLGYGMLSFVM